MLLISVLITSLTYWALTTYQHHQAFYKQANTVSIGQPKVSWLHVHHYLCL